VMRQGQSTRAEAFRQLLDADEIALALPVRLELVSGVSRQTRAGFKRGLSALPVLRPTDETWQLMEGWVARAADAGFHFSVTDLLVAALAHEIGALVWSVDGDFSAMQELGFVHLYE
jgi:predicted nucleic acid-binding protein